MAQGNKTIGRFHLDGLPPAPRGVPQSAQQQGPKGDGEVTDVDFEEVK